MSQDQTTQRGLVEAVDAARTDGGTRTAGGGVDTVGRSRDGTGTTVNPGGAVGGPDDAGVDPRIDDDRDDRSTDESTRVNVFQVGDTYLFRQYFEESAVFDALERFYNRRRYRFEVPAEAYRDVEGLLAGHGYDVAVVDDPAEYAVVVRKYSDHPEATFEDAVFQASTDDYNVFLLRNEAAVEEAVAAGATPLTDTPLRLKLPADPGVGPVTVADVADGTRW